MSKKEIEVTFETITPIWTGDINGECTEIKPASIMGSLRFWFEVYWKIVKKGFIGKIDKNGVPKENLFELENPKVNRTLRQILRKKIKEINNFDEAVDKSLDKLGLSVPSRIFGCTGWKSRIKIEIDNFEEEYIKFDKLEFEFPLNHNKQKSKTDFWIKKNLLNDNTKNSLNFFKNVKIKLITTDYLCDKYLYDFFEYFKDKLILVGGKNSFGFGFVNLSLDNNQDNLTNFNSIDNFLKIEKITNITCSEEKNVLGFNFKYYLRKKENENFRNNNFGEQGKSSKIYVSNLLENNSVYLLLLNNPFSEESKIPQHIFEKYVKWLKSINGDSRNE